MLGIFCISVALWLIYWGVYSIFHAKNIKRQKLSGILAPIGVILFFYGLLSLVAGSSGF